ncbi:MAG: tetratricopeptide repeat protein, partial [Acidobacteriota bacterium]
DACGHLFMEDAPPRRPQITAESFAAFSGTVEACYEYQDEVLADVLRLAGPETHVLVISDHGFKSGDQRPDTSGRADTGVAGLWHRLHGAIFLRGPGVRPGSTFSEASVLDMTPTVLALLDLPQAPDLPGEVLTEVFEPDRAPRARRGAETRWAPPAEAATTGGGEAAGTSLQLEKLQALGYLASSGDAAPIDDNGRSAASYVNEGTSLAVDGDVDAALRAYSRGLGLDPYNVQAIALSARLLIDRGDLERAAGLLDRAAQGHPQSVFVRLERAHLALARGAWADARQELAAAEALDSKLVQLPLYEAQWANATGAADQALAALQRAESLTDSDPMRLEIFLFRARIAAEQGKAALAEGALRQARALAHDDHVLAAADADLALAQARYPAAVRLFRRAIEHNASDPVLERKLAQALVANGDSLAAEAALRRALDKAKSPADRGGVFGDLALLLQQQGRDGQVVTLLQQATEELPRAANLWALLGAAHGRLEALEASLAAYQRSSELAEHPMTLKTLAVLLLHLRGEQQQAADLLRRSLALQPGQADVEQLLGNLATGAS